MLNIRLSRVGKNRQPSFRVIVQQHTAAVKGKFIEALGYYRPAVNPKEFKINVDRIKHWLSVGAQPSDSMAVLLKKEGLTGLDRYISPRDKKRKSKSEEKSAPAKATPAPAQQAPKAEAKVESKAQSPASAPEPVSEPKAETIEPAEAPTEPAAEPKSE